MGVSGGEVECRDVHVVVVMVTKSRDPISQPPVGDILGGYIQHEQKDKNLPIGQISHNNSLSSICEHHLSLSHVCKDLSG